MLGTYLLLTIISISLSTAVNFISIAELNSSIRRNNTAYLKQLTNLIEVHMRSIESICVNVEQSSSVDNLINSKENSYSDINNWIIGTIKDFKSYKANHNFIEEIFIIFKDRDIVIDTTAKYSEKIAYDVWFKEFYPTVFDWQDEINGNYFINYKVLNSSLGQKKVVCFQTLPIVNNFNAKATMMIVVNGKAITDYLQSMDELDGGEVYIANTDGEVIFGKTDLENIPPEHLSDDGRLISFPKNGSEHVIFSEKSKDTGWYYVMSVPREVYQRRLNLIKWLTWGVYFLCIVFGIYLSYRFSRKNYEPIEKIITKLRNALKGEAVGPKSSEPEYSYIDYALSEIIKNKNRYKEKTEKQSGLLKSDYILKILSGKAEAGNPSIEFSLSHFLVIVFDIVDLGLMESRKSKWEDLNMARFLISNVFEELTDTVAKCYFCEPNDGYACIVNYSGSDSGEWWFTEKIEYMSEFLKSHMNMEFVCGVSKASQEAEELPVLYKQATEMLGYRILENDKNILLYSDIVQNDLAVYRYDANTERQIINNILIGDYLKAMEVVDGVLILNFRENKLDLNMARLLIFEIASTIIKAIRETGSSNEAVDVCADKLANSVFHFKTIDEIRAGIDSTIKEICEIVNCNKKSSSHRLKEKVLSLIHEKYSDCSLNLKGVAFDAGISPNYLSTFFKEQIGKGFAEYILSYRIAKAKTLFDDTEMSVYEVSELVGFSNTNIFIRAFKKLEGITPGQYKTERSK